MPHGAAFRNRPQGGWHIEACSAADREINGRATAVSRAGTLLQACCKPCSGRSQARHKPAQAAANKGLLHGLVRVLTKAATGRAHGGPVARQAFARRFVCTDSALRAPPPTCPQRERAPPLRQARERRLTRRVHRPNQQRTRRRLPFALKRLNVRWLTSRRAIAHVFPHSSASGRRGRFL
jgi:hypothetical protein